MKNKSLYVVLIMAIALTTSCGSRKFLVYSPGENLTALTKVHETEYVCYAPNGGNDGKNLFFTMMDKSGYSNIYRKDNPNSVSASQLTGGHNHNSAPSYNAVTNKVAYSGSLEGNYVNDIYMVDALRGGAMTQITNTPTYIEKNPCFSRDGKRVVYERMLQFSDSRDTEIWIKNLQTNETTQIGLGSAPSFSPDGKTIVFVKPTSEGSNTTICIVNVDGTNQTQLTDVGMGVVWRPCFSPDGNYIVFSCYKKRKPDTDLYVIDRSGNGLTQLTVNTSYDGEPYWANDGNIYFTSDRGGRDKHYQIWRFRYGQALQQQSVQRVSNQPTTTYNNTQTQPPQSYTSTIYHTVQDGETITNIAKRYGITVRDVVKWNNLTTMTITTGMKLKVSAQ